MQAISAGMTTEARFERIEGSLDRLTALAVQTAERQSENELRLNAFITAIHEWQDAVVYDHKQLLTAQVIMAEKIDKFAEKMAEVAVAQTELAAAQTELAAAQKHTDKSLGVLIQIVDEIIRGRPRG